jgi:hypothetical protein
MVGLNVCLSIIAAAGHTFLSSWLHFSRFSGLVATCGEALSLLVTKKVLSTFIRVYLGKQLLSLLFCLNFL